MRTGIPIRRGTARRIGLNYEPPCIVRVYGNLDGERQRLLDDFIELKMPANATVTYLPAGPGAQRGRWEYEVRLDGLCPS